MSSLNCDSRCARISATSASHGSLIRWGIGRRLKDKVAADVVQDLFLQFLPVVSASRFCRDAAFLFCFFGLVVLFLLLQNPRCGSAAVPASSLYALSARFAPWNASPSGLHLLLVKLRQRLRIFLLTLRVGACFCLGSHL